MLGEEINDGLLVALARASDQNLAVVAHWCDLDRLRIAGTTYVRDRLRRTIVAAVWAGKVRSASRSLNRR